MIATAYPCQLCGAPSASTVCPTCRTLAADAAIGRHLIDEPVNDETEPDE